MSRFISVSIDLGFSAVPPGQFLGRDIALPGARPGDVVLLTEPPQRPPGLSLFAFVREPGWVGVCCKNKTGGSPISMPTGTYKLSIVKD
jgi:hypothetical protein